MTTSAPKAESPLFPVGSETWMSLWRTTFSELPMTLAFEITKFASHRLRAQSDFLAKLTRCKSYGDVLEAEAAFWQAASQDYRAETGRLMEDITVASSVKKAA